MAAQKHEHEHDHNHKHDHGHDHDHNHDHSHESRVKPSRIRLKAKNSLGAIYIERNIIDDAIVISGTLSVVTGNADLNAEIAREFEAAARKIAELGGIVGHIKATGIVTSTSMISVTDEHAMVKESPERMVKITLAAIVFFVDQKVASDIMQQALAGVRAASRE